MSNTTQPGYIGSDAYWVHEYTNWLEMAIFDAERASDSAFDRAESLGEFASQEAGEAAMAASQEADRILHALIDTMEAFEEMDDADQVATATAWSKTNDVPTSVAVFVSRHEQEAGR